MMGTHIVPTGEAQVAACSVASVVEVYTSPVLKLLCTKDDNKRLSPSSCEHYCGFAADFNLLASSPLPDIRAAVASSINWCHDSMHIM